MTKIYQVAVAAAVAVSSPAAFAGGFVAPVMEAPIAVSPATAVSHGDWTGAYVGATLGYVLGGAERVGFTDSATNTYLGDVGDFDLSGAQGGVHIGYRAQRDLWVYGAELGYEVSRADDTLSFDNQVGEGVMTSEVNNVLALRFKAGRALDAQTLIYGIAGVARGKFTYTFDGTVDDIPAISSTKYRQSGYVLGLGVERKVSERLSLTGEWEYASFGKTSIDVGGGMVTEATPKYHLLRMGVNYRF